VDHLSALALDERTTFLRDMSVLGEAVERACASNGLRRINYDILGNTDTFLHAHVFPRYSWEPADRVTMPVFLYPGDRWSDPHYHYTDQQHGALRVSIKDELVRITRDIVSGADKGS
jgi:diadenosine tetraphosphate (Ap4A) HIT family hydrolase